MHRFSYKRVSIIVVAMTLLVLPLIGCAAEEAAPPAPPPPPPPAGTISVTPDTVELAFPGMLRVPIEFSGTGWQPDELVAIEMVLPPGVEMKAVELGENVALAFAQADEAGKFKVAVGASTKILTIFRADLDLTRPGNVVPESIKPIPPDTYTIEAFSAESGNKSTTTLTFVAPPPKE